MSGEIPTDTKRVRATPPTLDQEESRSHGTREDREHRYWIWHGPAQNGTCLCPVPQSSVKPAIGSPASLAQQVHFHVAINKTSNTEVFIVLSLKI